MGGVSLSYLSQALSSTTKQNKAVQIRPCISISINSRSSSMSSSNSSYTNLGGIDWRTFVKIPHDLILQTTPEQGLGDGIYPL